MNNSSRSRVKFASSAICSLVILCGTTMLLSADDLIPPRAAQQLRGIPVAFIANNNPAPTEFDASKVMGAESCKKCHEAEYTAWTKTVHYGNHARLTNQAGQKYIAAYGGSEACKKCHSTPHTSSAKFANANVGVSCESCHTPAGGANGWFEVHSDYGGKDVKREEETEAHLQERLAACEDAGMIRAANLYELAKNCYSCHIVDDEKLLEAGHKSGHEDFSLVPWIQGEVRHNFQVDQSTNAESPSLLKARYGTTADERKRVAVVVGKIVELETLLRRLGSADPDNLSESYAGRRGWAGRAEDVLEYIEEDIGDEFDSEHIEAVVDAVDFDLGRRFDDQEAALEAADELAEIAKTFIEESQDEDLSALDVVVEDLDRPKGDTYEP